MTLFFLVYSISWASLSNWITNNLTQASRVSHLCGCAADLVTSLPPGFLHCTWFLCTLSNHFLQCFFFSSSNLLTLHNFKYSHFIHVFSVLLSIVFPSLPFLFFRISALVKLNTHYFSTVVHLPPSHQGTFFLFHSSYSSSLKFLVLNIR